jgi:alcohol dehydrogenase
MVVELADSRLESAVATLHLEKLWIRDVTVTAGLVDTYTIPGLMRLVASGRLDPTIFGTHRFALGP